MTGCFSSIKSIIITLVVLTGIQAQTSADTLKVLTFNVYGAPESEWPTRLSLIINEIVILNPDIICLQEIVETPGLQGVDNRAGILSDSLFKRTGIGYNYMWQPTHFSWGVFDEGIAIMSPHIILESDFVNLPAGLFTRKALYAKILSPSGIINVFNTHLSFGNQEPVRIQQVAAIKNFISAKSLENPASATILCGDFNAVPDSPPIQLLTQLDTSGIVYTDSWYTANPADPGFTMPSDNPDARIDYIFLRNNSDTEVLFSNKTFVTPNQDDILPSDHLGVLSGLNTHILPLNLTLISPALNSEIAGEVEISWSISNEDEDLTYKIFTSNDAGKSWTSLWAGASATKSYVWNTLQNADGANYLLQIAAIGDTSFGLTKMQETFVVNNPGNASPELKLLSPGTNENIQNTYNINWEAKDADSDVLLISIQHSVNNGVTWNDVAQNLENTGSYEWDTNLVPNSNKYKLRVQCFDGTLTANQISNTFTISNTRIDIPSANIIHSAGNGGGTVRANSYNIDLLTGHDYLLTFNDSLPGIKTYNVFDNTASMFVVQNTTGMDGVTEGPPFDGLRLLIFDYLNTQLDHANIYWNSAVTNLDFTVSLPTINIGGQIINGYPYPADYRITIADQVVDTSSNFLDAPEIPMKFTVFNTTANYPVDILFFERNPDYSISPLDRIYILEKDENQQPKITWLVSFGNTPSPILPVAGDEIIISTFKPFTSNDVFEFTSAITGINSKTIETPFEFTLEQNYPNPFNPLTKITFRIPDAAETELAIYTVIGQQIKTLANGFFPAGRHEVKWDASALASGLYFYKIKSGKYSAVKKALLLK